MRRLTGIGLIVCAALACPLGLAQEDLAALTTAPELRVYFGPGPVVRGTYTALELEYRPEQAADRQMVFICQVSSKHSYDDAAVSLHVSDIEGRELFEATQSVKLPRGTTPVRFTWLPEALAPGVYQLRFELRRGLGDLLTARELVMKKLSRQELEFTIETAHDEIASVQGHMAALAAQGMYPAYAILRTAIAEDVLPLALDGLAADEWRAADIGAQYVIRTAKSIKAQLAFGGLHPELVAPVPKPDLAALTIQEGGLVAQGRPIFLFGTRKSPPTEASMARLERYGFNTSLYEIPPAHTLSASGVNPAASLEAEEVFAAARRHNISVTALLSLEELGDDAFARWPEILRDAEGMRAIDFSHPAVRETLERHFAASGALLRGHPYLNSISLVRRPEFRLDSELIRDSFAQWALSNYGGLQPLNRAWHTRLRGPESISIPWASTRRIYRYDWEVYHQGVATGFLDWAAGEVSRASGGVPVWTMLGEELLGVEQSAAGINWEVVGKEMDIAGVAAMQNDRAADFAISYPMPVMYYEMMRSLTPNKPLFNGDLRLDTHFDRPPGEVFRFVHSALWEGVIAGLDGAIVDAASEVDWLENLDHSDLWGRPEWWEGFATAALDINRLAPVVRAFQEAPTEVAILWSFSSNIYDGGDPHIPSLTRAYEGASFFGRKLRFITEEQLKNEGLGNIRVLIIPETPALADEAFQVVNAYIQGGGLLIRMATPIPFNAKGEPRSDALSTSTRSFLVRGGETPINYLHAMDAAYDLGSLRPVPQCVTAYGYPIEGVKTRYVNYEGVEYLYVINLRWEPMLVHFANSAAGGRDLISGERVEFPLELEPLKPMLIALTPGDQPVIAAAEEIRQGLVAGQKGWVPTADVKPIEVPEEVSRSNVRPLERKGIRPNYKAKKPHWTVP